MKPCITIRYTLSVGEVARLRAGQPPGLIAPASIKPAMPQPFAGWPVWAKGVALLEAEEDAGIGDTIARMLKKASLGAFTSSNLKKIGIDCGCDANQARLNVKYRYVKTLKA